MPYQVDFKNVATIGLETSPVAVALAGLRANEARYFMNKYKADFIVHAAEDSPEVLAWVTKILLEERNIVIQSPALETALLFVENIKWAHVFYESGLAVNVLYPLDEPKKRAVGFKLSEGMEIPEELGKFKFARQKSKLAGTLRGSFFVIKKEH
ncbi:MAG: phage tail protein [Bacteroidetes bacterium]|nr:phage tail protein [Bacteroidota bacterium]